MKIEMNKKYKNSIYNMVYNIIASFLPVIAISLIIQPLVARSMTSEIFGTFIAVTGIINLSVGIWGSSISYNKLLSYDKYNNNDNNYNSILIINIILSIITYIIIIKLMNINIGNILLIISSFVMVLALLDNYLLIEHKINVKYKRILVNKIFLVIGYGFGTILYLYSNNKYWIIIYVVGYASVTIYNIFTTKSIKDKVSFKKIDKKYLNVFTLVLAYSISGMSTYLDKIIIFPLLGATNLSYFQVASFSGKIVPLIASSTGQVILSYLANSSKIKKNRFNKYNLIVIGGSAAIYIILNILVPFVIKILYPQYINEVYHLIPYVNLIASLNIIYSFIYSFVLYYSKIKNQYIVNLSRLIPNIILSILLIPKYKLIGFSIATIIACIIQIIIMYIIYYNTYNDDNNNKYLCDFKKRKYSYNKDDVNIDLS